MTHSLHRKGTKSKLKNDYPILTMVAAGINDKKPESREKLLRIAEILKENDPDNILTEKAWKISPVIQAAFDDPKKVKDVLKRLKKEDLGISTVVSGLISEIRELIEEVGLKMHTVHLSLGNFGNKELLPDKKILEITTLCGHHCVSPQSVQYYVKQIKKGKISISKAAEKLAKPCVCGIFNTTRASEVLEELTKR
ncbi:MAG: hypothetical protein GF383_03255 [Candidatus Lokiarchaeota archaeon]|nr:hypothetical protein [Candidatus Lokiarchaeota archaeon]MBD3338632.1 hypothetical protein [Candidatus Lokiarchaeota archaeon]